jgi:hypothetical protein
MYNENTLIRVDGHFDANFTHAIVKIIRCYIRVVGFSGFVSSISHLAKTKIQKKILVYDKNIFFLNFSFNQAVLSFRQSLKELRGIFNITGRFLVVHTPLPAK